MFYGVVVVSEALEEGIGVGGDGSFGGVAGDDVWDCEAVFFEGDGAGGAGDIFEVEDEGIEERFFADSGGELASSGLVEPGDVAVDGCEVAFGFGAIGKVGGVVSPEGLDSGEAGVAALVAVVHSFIWKVEGRKLKGVE